MAHHVELLSLVFGKRVEAAAERDLVGLKRVRMHVAEELDRLGAHGALGLHRTDWVRAGRHSVGSGWLQGLADLGELLVQICARTGHEEERREDADHGAWDHAKG